MSRKSANSRTTKAIDRPFDADIWQRAAAVAQRYQIVLHFESGACYGRGLELPYVMADGPDAETCVSATREALTVCVATLLERGEMPPSPATARRRSEQVNVRVTAEEKLVLQEAARDRGYRGVGDFVRSTALANLQS